MSLLSKAGASSIPLPDLSGRELLDAPGAAGGCKVKGVMLVGRNRFLRDVYGERELSAVLARLSPDVAKFASMPLAASWVPFSVLVEYDKAIYDHFRDREPGILALVGAASAEYGIGTIYRVLDSVELTKFLEGFAHFHAQFGNFGRVAFRKTPKGCVLEYFDYRAFSPYFCASAIGFFFEAILRHGGRDPRVAETKCHCRGDAVCRYELTWEG